MSKISDPCPDCKEKIMNEPKPTKPVYGADGMLHGYEYWPREREALKQWMKETKSEPKHTPGPWYWSNKGGVCILYRQGERGVVLRTQPQAGSTTYDLTEPDARLLAAAPDLLEALEVVMANRYSEDARRSAEAAIAKATGIEPPA